ncbi:hypothetical protein F4825DRAFT_118388 [Nemania diffusa]|nr:hypothetical protein F4825DRAFT_118388 [Nemania diffusa]
MKYTVAAALLPLLASAANIDARQATDLKFEISNFTAACTPDIIDCVYSITIIVSDNPDFSESCQAFGTNTDGTLPAVNEMQCGTYTLSVAKLNDGGLNLTIGSESDRLTGSYTIPSDDLVISTSGDHKEQSYVGDTSFNIDAKHASSASSPASGTSTSTTASTPITSSSSASSPTSSVSSTTASEPSTTGTTTSSSPSPGETNSATRESAFAGVMFAVGLIAFMF